eukprot:364963-Chlamydomonas_euryale.AAC.7
MCGLHAQITQQRTSCAASMTHGRAGRAAGHTAAVYPGRPRLSCTDGPLRMREPLPHAVTELATGSGSTRRLGLARFCWRRCTALASSGFEPGDRPRASVTRLSQQDVGWLFPFVPASSVLGFGFGFGFASSFACWTHRCGFRADETSVNESVYTPTYSTYRPSPAAPWSRRDVAWCAAQVRRRGGVAAWRGGGGSNLLSTRNRRAHARGLGHREHPRVEASVCRRVLAQTRAGRVFVTAVWRSEATFGGCGAGGNGRNQTAIELPCVATCVRRAGATAPRGGHCGRRPGDNNSMPAPA